MPRSQRPRKDLTLVRKLKDAPREPGFRPTDLLGDGSALLEKASRIQGFLKGQRQRTGGSSSKTEWMLAAQQLQDEQETTEKELTTSLRSILSSTHPDMVAFAADMLSEWQASSLACRGLQASLKQQVHAAVAMHGSIRKQGIANAQEEAQQLQQELHDLQQDIQRQCVLLETELQHVMQQELWPSALPGAPGAVSTSQRHVLSLSSAPSLPRNNSLQKAPAGALTPISEQGPESYNEDIQESAYDNDGWAGGTGIGGGAAAAWARDAQQLDNVIGCFPLADDTAKARVRVVFAALRQRHQQKLDAWHDGAGIACECSGAGTAGPNGGWPEAEHSLFVSLRLKCWRDRVGGRGGGASRDALMRQLAVLMPSRTLEELIAHDDWLTNHKILQRKRRGLLDAWSREKAQFLEDSAALLDESHQGTVARAQQAADRLAHELGREVLRDNLEDLRAIAQWEAEETAETEAAAAAVLAGQRAAAEAVAREEAAHNKALIAAYRAELQAKLDVEAAVAAATLAAAETTRIAQAASNRERVEWRHAELLVKQDKQREAAAEREADLAAREARLARLRALVAPDVACDPNRVLLPTEASSAVDDKAAGAFREVHGYTVDQVYRDQRMRVWEALSAAGLANTQYGRQAVCAAPAATQTRADNLTLEQRQAR